MPSVGACSPAIVRSSVDLPAPFAPMIAYTSPGYTASEMPASARSCPWWTTRSRTSSSGPAARSPGPFGSLMLPVFLGGVWGGRPPGAHCIILFGWVWGRLPCGGHCVFRFRLCGQRVGPQVGVGAEVDLAHPGVGEHLGRGAVADE